MINISFRKTRIHNVSTGQSQAVIQICEPNANDYNNILTRKSCSYISILNELSAFCYKFKNKNIRALLYLFVTFMGLFIAALGKTWTIFYFS